MLTMVGQRAGLKAITPASRIDIADSDRSPIRSSLTAATIPAASSFSVIRFGRGTAGGVADRRPTIDTNVDRACAFPLAITLGRGLHPTAGTGLLLSLVST